MTSDFSYLQSQPCPNPMCGKIGCTQHCNFVIDDDDFYFACGKEIRDKVDGYFWYSKKTGKPHKSNPDGSLHALCIHQNKRDIDRRMEEFKVKWDIVRVSRTP